MDPRNRCQTFSALEPHKIAIAFQKPLWHDITIIQNSIMKRTSLTRFACLLVLLTLQHFSAFAQDAIAVARAKLETAQSRVIDANSEIGWRQEEANRANVVAGSGKSSPAEAQIARETKKKNEVRIAELKKNLLTWQQDVKTCEFNLKTLEGNKPTGGTAGGSVGDNLAPPVQKKSQPKQKP